MGKDCPYSIQNTRKSVFMETKSKDFGTKYPRINQITKHKCP
jgi:hypothetical protein